MIYSYIYKTSVEFDDIILESDKEFLTKLVFLNSSDVYKLSKEAKFKDLRIFEITKKWLDIYFKGEIPNLL